MKKLQWRHIFPKKLWDYSFTYWWVISLITLFVFDLLWMAQTTFRPLSLFQFWVFLILGATVLASPSVFSRKGYSNALLLLVVDIVMTANLMYCRTYFNAIPARSYLLVGNLTDFTASVTDSFRWYYAILPVFTILAYLFYISNIPGKKRPGGWRSYLASLFVLACIAWGIDASTGGTLAKISEMSESPYEATCIVPVYGIPGYVAHDILVSSEKLPDSEKKKVDEWLETHLTLAQLPETDSLSYVGANDSLLRKNLVIILCESLESWPIGKKIEGKEVTPFINSLIADSTTFYAPNVVSQVGNGRSIDAQLIILAGLLPMRHGVYAYDASENQFYTLPEAVKQYGGRSYLLTCDKPYVWNESRVAAAFGIDTILSSSAFRIDETAGPRRRLSDGSFMRQTVEKLKQGEIWPEGEIAFLLMVTYSGHNPFNLPEKLRKINFDGDYPEIIKNYLITANYTDDSLRDIIDYLKTRPDWDETLVVITGDHEGLASDRKEALENKNSSKFVDPGQHTPLIILNSPVRGTFTGTMGEIDIYPTLLDLMGNNSEKWKGVGFSVTDARNGTFNSNFKGIAVSSSGMLEGDTSSTDTGLKKHIEKARDVSDLILRFNLLNNRPDL